MEIIMQNKGLALVLCIAIISSIANKNSYNSLDKNLHWIFNIPLFYLFNVWGVSVIFYIFSFCIFKYIIISKYIFSLMPQIDYLGSFLGFIINTFLAFLTLPIMFIVIGFVVFAPAFLIAKIYNSLFKKLDK
jgi:hypothetical protein